MNPIDYVAEEMLGKAIFTAEHLGGPGTLEKRVDAVVVGSGPGGLTAAAAMVENGLSVLVLEAGAFWPRGSFKRNQSWALQHLYQDKGARVAFGNAFIPVMSGRGVGGGTIVNSGICFRAPDWILDEWQRDQGIAHWDDRESLYEEVEQMIGVQPTATNVAGQNSEIARRGFSKMSGISHAYMPRNTPGCVGCGTCQTGCPSGGKASADVTWLPRALKSGVQVHADSKVDSIIMDGSRAVGVRGHVIDQETRKPTRPFEVKADKVVLALGSINTPQILQRQNLANSSEMVGENLHMQPGCGTAAQFEEEIKVWSGATQGYFAYHPEERELLAETFSAPPEAFFTQIGSIGHKSAEFLRQLKHLAVCGFLIRDRSAGSVKANGNKPVVITYNMNRDDQRKMRLGVEFVSEMMFEAGSRRVRPLLAGGVFYSSWNECRQFIRSVGDIADYQLYASHPMGTCRMGEDPTQNVVRPTDGRTHDHEGLYVVDSSTLPTAMGVNPQVTIMANTLAMARNIV